jgi:ribosomal protein L37AE/L43A
MASFSECPSCGDDVKQDRNGDWICVDNECGWTSKDESEQ